MHVHSGPLAGDGVTLVVLGLLFNLTWFHAARHHRLLRTDVAPEVIRAMGRHFAGGSVLWAAITLVALVRVELSLAFYVLVLAYYGVTGIRRGSI